MSIPLTKALITPSVVLGLMERCKFIDGHWIWAGMLVKRIRRSKTFYYPMYWIDGKQFLVRKISYAMLREDVAHGQIRVTCGHELCVNPLHLEELIPHSQITSHGRSQRV